MVDNTFVPGIHSDIISRFPGVEIVYYGVARPGGPQPNGPEIVLTAEQFRNTFSTPQTIIPIESGRIIIPRRMHVRKEAGSGFVAGSNTGLRFRLGAAGTIVTANATVAQFRFDQADEIAIIYILPISGTGGARGSLGFPLDFDGAATANQPLILQGITANISSGGSPVHISVLAELWPISLS